MFFSSVAAKIISYSYSRISQLSLNLIHPNYIFVLEKYFYNSHACLQGFNMKLATSPFIVNYEIQYVWNQCIWHLKEKYED